MDIGILGAGIQGTLAALAIAARGKRVRIFEREPMAISRASRWNEGKIHFGFIDANDTSLLTAKKMAEGALSFQPILEKLCGTTIPGDAISAPFNHARHKESLLSAEHLAEHYEKVEKIIEKSLEKYPAGYFGYVGGPVCKLLSPNEIEANYDSNFNTHAWSTIENSVHPHKIADILIDTIENEPLIETIYSANILGVDRMRSGILSVSVEGDQTSHRFDHVVNTLWESRLLIDRTPR